MALLRLFATISLRKINGDSLNERGDHVVTLLNNNTRTSSVISVCLNMDPLISLIPANHLEF